jgi:peptidylprolyl isomerase
MNRTLPAALALALGLGLAGCSSSSTAETTQSTAAADAGSTGDSYSYEGVAVTGAEGAEPTITLDADFGAVDELGVADVYAGSGDAVEPGATVTVNYVGVGQMSGEVFDSSWQRGEPATFPLDQVIEGWSQGLVGMQPGGRRVLVIPAEQAYGDAGAGADIAPGETLVFVVDLIDETPAG